MGFAKYALVNISAKSSKPSFGGWTEGGRALKYLEVSSGLWLVEGSWGSRAK